MADDKKYPFTKFYFSVDIDQGFSDASFAELKVPTASVEVIKYRDGNSKDFTQYNVPGLVTHDPVTLKYALRTTVDFRKWVLDCVKDAGRATGDMRKTTVTISLKDPGGDSAVKQWILKNAWVSKYEGPDLNSTATDIAMESIDIAYDNLEIKE